MAARQESAQSGFVHLILATVAITICFMVWGAISPLAPTFRDLYGLSSVQVGLLVAVPVLLGSIARVPLGLLADRYGGRTVFTVLLVTLVVPTGLAGFADSFAELLALSFFLGLAGASFAVGVPFVSHWFPPERQGFALGVYGIGTVGTALAGFMAPRVADAYGWRWVFWSLVPLLVVMALVFWALARDAPTSMPRRQIPLAEQFAVFRARPVAWILALFHFVCFGGFVAISMYLPTLLVSEYGLSSTEAATRAASFILVATLARPVGGYLADRWGGSPLLNVVFLIVAFFAIILAFEPGLPVVTVVFLGMGLALGLGGGAVFELVPELFPQHVGTVGGLVATAGGLGGFFPPILMSIVYDQTGSYAIAYMLLSEFALACLLVNVLVLQRGWSLLQAGD